MEHRGIVGKSPCQHVLEKTKTWCSSGEVELPMATTPLSEDDESELMYYLSTELNRLQGLGLATQLAINRDMASSDNKEKNWLF